MEDTNSVKQELLEALKHSIQRNLTDGLLLSGGLDTSVLAYLMTQWQKPRCVTVAWRRGLALDVPYAVMIATQLGLEHHLYWFDDNEFESALVETMRLLRTFDPMELRNSGAIYIAMKEAKRHGISGVMTGDAGDELFAGYDFFFKMGKRALRASLKHMWSQMSFSSLPLGRALELEVTIPFLVADLMALAKSIDVSLKIRKEGLHYFGKWIVRKALEGIVPAEVLWRVKSPIEAGTGTNSLSSFMEKRIPDAEFQQEKEKHLAEDGVTLQSKEHLYCYRLYRDMFGVPHASPDAKVTCPQCNSAVPEGRNFCKVCGAYPVHTQ